MRSSLFYHKYTILLLAFFSPMIINIGGEVSPSFLFILITLPWWYKLVEWESNKLTRLIVRLFILLLVVQILWIPFATTDIITQIKGVLITLSGLLFFLYFYMVYKYNYKVIKWFYLGEFLSSFFFVNILVEIQGSEFGMWKFQIMPRIVNGAVVVYLWMIDGRLLWNVNWRNYIFSALFIIIGTIGLVTGARSVGMTPLISGVLLLMLIQYKSFRLNLLNRFLVAGGVVLYTAYALIYVPGVIKGTITGGNTDQLRQVENPYNPIHLLMMGRTDSFIPFKAFLDKPLTGWGYKTVDPDNKYRRELLKMKKDEDGSIRRQLREREIPGHSVWGYYSCSYGILAFLILLFMVGIVSKIFYYSLLVRDDYLMLRIYVFITFIWNILFSPIAHFKTLPMNMAIVMVFSLYAIQKIVPSNKFKSI